MGPISFAPFPCIVLGLAAFHTPANDVLDSERGSSQFFIVRRNYRTNFRSLALCHAFWAVCIALIPGYLRKTSEDSGGKLWEPKSRCDRFGVVRSGAEKIRSGRLRQFLGQVKNGDSLFKSHDHDDVLVLYYSLPSRQSVSLIVL